MIRPEKETEDQLLSITKNCQMFIEQTNGKAEETLDFKFTKSKEIFHFKPPIQIERSWMSGLTNLEVYIFIFNLTDKKNNIELYNFLDSKSGGISYQKVKDEIGKEMEISGITATDLQDEIIGPIFLDDYRKQVTKRMKDDKHMNILSRYTSSKIQDFESFLRTEVDLVENDIRLVLY